MLVLTRKVGERIMIGESIVLTVVRIQGDKIRLGIDAPQEVTIHREEIRERQHPPAPTTPLAVPAPLERIRRIDPGR
ncbi:MAG: carbon storage regulator CsrA [Isosphaeraceae bacterium]